MGAFKQYEDERNETYWFMYSSQEAMLETNLSINAYSSKMREREVWSKSVEAGFMTSLSVLVELEDQK